MVNEETCAAIFAGQVCRIRLNVNRSGGVEIVDSRWAAQRTSLFKILSQTRFHDVDNLELAISN
jgi:hypothetical protein